MKNSTTVSFESAWQYVVQIPGVCRNPDYNGWLRRPLGPTSGVVATYNPSHILTKRPSSILAGPSTPSSTSSTPSSTPTLPPPHSVVVHRPFNPNGFHFGKIKPNEIVAIVDLQRGGKKEQPIAYFAGTTTGITENRDSEEEEMYFQGHVSYGSTTSTSTSSTTTVQVKSDADANNGSNKGAGAISSAASSCPVLAAAVEGGIQFHNRGSRSSRNGGGGGAGGEEEDLIISGGGIDAGRATPPSSSPHHHHLHPILINASPLFPYHSLFVPDLLHGRPQVATAETLLPVLRLSRLFGSCSERNITKEDNDNDDAKRKNQRSREFRIGFNSLDAFASVNHFHTHIVYAGDLFSSNNNGSGDGGDETAHQVTAAAKFPVERAPCGDILHISAPISVPRQDINDHNHHQEQGETREEEEVVVVRPLAWHVPGFYFSLQRQQRRGEDEEKNTDTETDTGKNSSAAEAEVVEWDPHLVKASDAGLETLAAAAGSFCFAMGRGGEAEEVVDDEKNLQSASSSSSLFTPFPPIPHHFLVTNAGTGVIVLPRLKQRPSFEGRSQLALAEMIGLAIFNDPNAYYEGVGVVTEEEFIEEMKTFAVSEEIYGRLCALAAKCVEEVCVSERGKRRG